MQSLRPFSRLLFAFGFALALGCQSDSPTEPGIPPATSKPPVPVTTFNITVTASPSDLSAGEATSSSTVTVQVRRSDNGATPPDGTQVTLNTSLGSFNSPEGPRSIQVQLVGGRAQAVLFAGTEAGTATVQALFSGSSGVANVRINLAATFFVESVQPGTGNPQGGEEVVINGGGFDEPVRVTFNGAAATVLSVTGSRIRVITPSAVAAGVQVGVGEARPVAVSVTINVNEPGTVTDALPGGFTYALGGGSPTQPQVLSVSPQSGSNDGGTRVRIRGDGFSSPVQVLFGEGGTAAGFNGVEAIVESVTPTEIVAVTPAARAFGQDNLNQVVSILIKNLNTGFSTVSSGSFKYGTEIIITALGLQGNPEAAGGFRVLVQGQGFDDPVAVEFCFSSPAVCVGQAVISVTGTQVLVLAGPAPLPAECPENGLIEVESIQMTNIETGDTADADLGFNYFIPLPQIFGINPSSGSPGTNAVVNGRNFAPNVQVLFGPVDNASAAAITSGTSTSLSIRVPSAPQGFTFITEPCDGNGDGIPGGTRLSPTPISVTVVNLDGTGCDVTLPNSFLLTPPNSTCTGDTSTPPPAPTVQCNDGFDNDSDTFIDGADPQCTGPTDNSEGS